MRRDSGPAGWRPRSRPRAEAWVRSGGIGNRAGGPMPSSRPNALQLVAGIDVVGVGSGLGLRFAGPEDRPPIGANHNPAKNVGADVDQPGLSWASSEATNRLTDQMGWLLGSR